MLSLFSKKHLASFMLATFVFANSLAAPVSSTESDKSQQTDKPPLEEIQRFTNAISQIKSYYVKPVSDRSLFENAIRGMLESLDPHSAYLDEKDFYELNASTKGEFSGLGLEVTLENDVIKVVSPIDDTPAAKAGVKPGDYIVLLNNEPVKGMSLSDAVQKMRGPKGSKIKLTIIRKNVPKPIIITVVRDNIVIQSVKTQLFDNKFGYLRISHFQQNTQPDVLTAITNLQKQANGKLAGLILDLRNNPGGLLDSAVQVADDFLTANGNKPELIVYTKGRIPSSQFNAYAKPGDLLNGAPMVVLINEGSASGSEIVAGALQDYRRAVVVGTRSFGKGSVQTVLPLDGKTGLKLTTALYYTPLGRSIQAMGIEPDITINNEVVEEPSTKDLLDQVASLKEADLERHLKNGNGGNKDKNNNNGVVSKDSNIVYTDFQLYGALNILKGLVANKGKG